MSHTELQDTLVAFSAMEVMLDHALKGGSTGSAKRRRQTTNN